MIFAYAGLAVLVVAAVVAVRGAKRTMPAPRLMPATTDGPSLGRRVLTGASRSADAALQGSERGRALRRALEESEIDLPPGELVAVTAAASMGALLVGLVLAGPIGVALAIVPPVAVFALVRRRREARRKAFAEQLPDVLQLLSGNLRVGYGLLQAIETATREAEAPASEELRRATGEVRLGRDLVDALDGIAERLGNEDFSWVVQAIAINRDVGGDLAEVLDAVAGTIRDRAHLARHVSALSAEGRLSAYVLFLLPIAVGGFMFMSNRDYIAVLYTTGTGLALCGLSAALMTVGALWLRRLVRLVF
jgi:tight adherence protein B